LAGLIAALYVVLGLAFLPISFGVYQLRVAEALTVLPFLTRAAIPGLFIGCLLANLFGGMGWQDIVFGSLLTLIAAILTRLVYLFSRRLQKAQIVSSDTLGVVLAPLPPVLINAFGVAAYLAPIIGLGYWFSVQMIGVGQLAACYGLGVPLMKLMQKRGWLLNELTH
jgi:uncharacterized membrane protein